MTVRGVWVAPGVDDGGYRIALAGLPLRAQLTKDPRGAVAVLGGQDAGRCARHALAAGAVGLVITDPDAVSAADAKTIAAVAGRMPVVVDRALLRVDTVAQAVAGRAGEPALLVAAEVRAPGSQAGGAVRDAIGWARALSVDPFEVVEAGGRSARYGALLHGSISRVPLVLTVTRATKDARSPELHLTALGATRSEVQLDPAAGIVRVSTLDAEGEHVAPTLREARARLVLRRCIDALEHGRSTTDLLDLCDDADAAERVIARVTRS